MTKDNEARRPGGLYDRERMVRGVADVAIGGGAGGAGGAGDGGQSALSDVEQITRAIDRLAVTISASAALVAHTIATVHGADLGRLEFDELTALAARTGDTLAMETDDRIAERESKHDRDPISRKP